MKVYFFVIALVSATSLFATILRSKRSSVDISGNYHYNVFFVFVTGLILSIVSGLRYMVGTDYLQYSYSYSNYIARLWESIIFFDEPGINILAKISSYIYDDYATMFLLTAIVTVGLVVLTISKKSSSFFLSILLYIFIGSWHGSFNGVRQFLAASIVLYGHKYIIEKKFVKYLFIIILASSFHISAFIMLLVYFIPRRRLSVKDFVILILISLVSLYSYNYILEFINTYRYSGKDITQYAYVMRSVSTLRILVAFVPVIFFGVFTNKSILNSTHFFYINMIIVNALFAITTSNSAYLARFVVYTNIFLVLGYPALLTVNNVRFKLVAKYFILLFYSLYWYYEVSISSSLSNYQWIFERL